MRWKNYDRFIKIINYLLRNKNEIPPTNDIETKELAILRCYEEIGGILKNWEEETKFDDPIITGAIRMRDKISHFYGGIDWEIVKDAMEDLQKLKEKIETLHALDKP